MTGRRAITAAASPDACVPHVTGVVRLVPLGKELLKRNSAGDFTTPHTVRGHRHPDIAADPSSQLTSLVSLLVLGR